MIENGIAFSEPIKPDSWLNEPRFAWFKTGYQYAQTQTRAIPALAQIAPEELFFAVSSILRGAKKDAPNVLEDWLKTL
jgi:broad specificity phosphatase PhoE